MAAAPSTQCRCLPHGVDLRVTSGRRGYHPSMLTVGVDLAAEAERTAIAWIDWAPSDAVIRYVTVGADDRQIIQAISQAEKAGIDCPLGWPEKFIAFISAHQH